MVDPSCENYDSGAISTSELSTDKQGVKHCLDIVYGYNTAGRHLIIELTRTFIHE